MSTENNPLLEPIHGISLKVYAEVALKMSQGIDAQAICKALGIEPAVWEEVNTLWIKRMQEDATFTIAMLYGQYFSEEITHPQLKQLQVQMSAEGAANLEKIKTDRYFYEELSGARTAAYQYGIDGTQWILDNYGITLGDFQAVAMQYMTEQNKHFDELMPGNSGQTVVSHFVQYQQQKQKEYAEKFAAEQGGNVADDIEF